MTSPSTGAPTSTETVAPAPHATPGTDVPTTAAPVRAPDGPPETTPPPAQRAAPGARGPGPSPETPPPQTSTTIAEPPALTARIEVAAPTVRAGEDLAGVLVVTNPSGSTVALSAGECQPRWGMYFAPGMTPIFTADCRPGVLSFAPGETRLPFSVRASLRACSQDESPSGELPACGTGPDLMPPLDPGPYRVALHVTAPGLVAEAVPVDVIPA